ncbi:unnamed protein product [Bursaphelenchus xylophilus]|uniref:Carboxylic ester hydrolase n=1 Tax=Bursaphelenchus xylophilus TaxID=6326 RepID=A0A1I7S7X1_BURXY|nr:unnamed protein product [Bursaphelenchus xylophilus]CAG9087175.1 unnamed protein product [Bursaphelenchus xylophilus]
MSSIIIGLLSFNLAAGVVVQTASGPVDGLELDLEGKKINVYLGIPYGEAPVGAGRFKKPLYVKPWAGTKNCTSFGFSCHYFEPTPRPFLTNPPFSEDCLNLNIYAPSIPTGSSTKLPVLFYIHGGGYLTDTAAFFGLEITAKILPKKDVIVVTVNYRLGLFGFLSTPEGTVPGNQGLWDMALALEWTYDNIERFGGDKAKITVGGQSAGSMASELLFLSPKSQGMINQLILMSGTNYDTMAPHADPQLYANILEFAKEEGLKSSSEADLVEFLSALPAEKISLNFGGNTKDHPNITMKPWTVIDGELLPRSLDELRKQAPKVNVLIGVTRNEGLMFVNNPNLTACAMEKISEYCDAKHLKVTDLQEEDLFHHFVHQDLLSNSTEYTQEVLDIISDLTFNNGIYQCAEGLAGEDERNTFVYRFDFYQKRDATTVFPRVIEGATHCDDLRYIFGIDLIREYKPTEEDLAMTEQFSDYIANFIKTGNPGSNWPKVLGNSGNVANLIIDLNNTRVSDDLFDGRAKYWRDYGSSAQFIANTLVIFAGYLFLVL